MRKKKYLESFGELKQFKKENDAIIAVGGCMMQEEHMIDKLNRSYPFVDIIFGTHTLYRFGEDLYRVFLETKKVQDVICIDGEVYEGLPIKRNDDKKASVTIMYGCNNFCSYCIVPYVRGRERSRKAEDILNEIEGLAIDGYKEVTLLGQNVNSYSNGEEYGFAKLLEEVEKIEGIDIIKFISPHPKDFTDDVIDVISKSKKISKLIHIPLQSGSTNILTAMNRKYSKEDFMTLICKIQEKVPNTLFSTDVIVGFPGETDKDFEETLDVIKKINFEQVYMFIYSRRVGTLADKMKDQIPEDIKHERFDKLKKLVDEKVEKSNKKYIDNIFKILVEGYSKTNSSTLTGRTDTNKVVIFEGDEELIGKVVDIKIVSEHRWHLKGVINK